MGPIKTLGILKEKPFSNRARKIFNKANPHLAVGEFTPSQFAAMQLSEQLYGSKFPSSPDEYSLNPIEEASESVAVNVGIDMDSIKEEYMEDEEEESEFM